jgi:hypothetical protein
MTPPPTFSPNAWNHLAGYGISTDGGDQPDKGDSSVPKFDGCGAGLLHNDRG